MSLHPTLARAYARAVKESEQRALELIRRGATRYTADATWRRLTRTEAHLYAKLPAHVRAAIQHPAFGGNVQ